MRSGIRAIICKTRLCRQPALAGIKHLNRLEQVLARAEWNDPEIHEGLMLDQGRRVVEGTKSNVFLLCGNELVTPPLTDCGIAGIMRSVILDLARGLGLVVRVRAVALADLRNAGEVFVCNSLIGIWPVRSIEKVGRYPVGRITCDLIEALKEHRDSGDGRWYSS